MNKDIDKAARGYALKRYPEEYGDDAYEAGLRTGYRNGYADSHISRQSEIDELIEALGEMHKACSNIEEMNTHGNGKAALIRNYVQLWWPKATQLLEKYGNK